MKQFDLKQDDAEILSSNSALSVFFEESIKDMRNRSTNS